jgi:hypothetical protein
LSPPHTPHASGRRPLRGAPSHPAQERLSPPQTPHASGRTPLLGTPSQPAQVELFPPQTPHMSLEEMRPFVWLHVRHELLKLRNLSRDLLLGLQHPRILRS